MEKRSGTAIQVLEILIQQNQTGFIIYHKDTEIKQLKL